MAIAPHTERRPPAEVTCHLATAGGVQQTYLAPTVSSAVFLRQVLLFLGLAPSFIRNKRMQPSCIGSILPSSLEIDTFSEWRLLCRL